MFSFQYGMADRVLPSRSSGEAGEEGIPRGGRDRGRPDMYLDDEQASG